MRIYYEDGLTQYLYMLLEEANFRKEEGVINITID